MGFNSVFKGLMTENRNRGKLIEFWHVCGRSMKDAVCKYDRQGKGRIRHKEVLRKVLYWNKC
jgi:hypothetical protein